MKCALCGSDDIVIFHEHYKFCRECGSIYTSLIILETNCEHITDASVSVEHAPWYAKVREENSYIIKDACSTCGKRAIADGW